jgi:hypothetical protein
LIQQHSGSSDSQLPQRNWNALFRGDYALGAYNACVGDNGCPDLYFYADGFADSVFLLIDALTSGQKAMLDTLIYPICFNLRHSVELTIKGQIEDLSRLAKLRKQPLAPDTEVDKVLNQHDILKLWAFFQAMRLRLIGVIRKSCQRWNLSFAVLVKQIPPVRHFATVTVRKPRNI